MALTVNVESLGLQELYREGVILCRSEGLVPALAAHRLVIIHDLTEAQLRELARIGLAAKIGLFLAAGRIDEAARTGGGGPINPSRTAGYDVLTKLYEGATGTMKPLLQFTVADCQYVEDTFTARAKGNQKIANAARMSLDALTRENKERIEQLSVAARQELEAAWS